MKIIGITLLVLCFNISCIAQQRVNQIIKQRIEEKHIPGFAFIVAKNGEIVEEGYYGLANVELNVPLSEKSVFAIASMSKTYTAAATLLLVEEGRLSLNDPINKYIQEAPESWKDITIKHLLTHSSGLADDWGLYSWDESNEFFLKSQTDSSFLQHLFNQKLSFKPGTGTYYSSGPFVLGVIIERITGKYYGEYLEEVIFKHLGLKQTYVDDPYELIENRVAGYIIHDSTEMDVKFSGIGNGLLISPISYGRADVGIRTTARDLLKFYNALLNGRLLNKKSAQLMFTPSTLNNGNFVPTAPGWMNWPLAGNIISQHSGVFRTGFSSQGFIIPSEKFIIILLSNTFEGTNFSLVQKIASNYYEEFSQLSERELATDGNQNLTAQHLELFISLASDNFREDLVNTKFPKSYLSIGLKNALAKTESITFLGEDNVSAKDIKLFGTKIHTMRYYKLNQNKTLYTTVSLDRDGKVVFIDYPETE